MKRIMMLCMIAVLLISGTVGYAQCVSMDLAFYTHEQLMEDAQALCAQYANFVELERIGVSADQREIIALRIGNRIVVPKEAFIRWVEQHTGGTE